MKITDITVYLAKEWRTFLFVVIDTDEGIYGLGEAGLTGRELAVKGAIEHFKPLLIGEDPARIEHIWQRLFRGGFYPGGPILSSAIAAIDIALWDIKGKALGVPLYQLFGGRVRDRVMTYTHLHGDVVEAAERAVSEGWKCLRWEPAYGEDGVINPRKSVDRSIEEWRRVRDAVGDDIELCYDAHTKLDVTEAIRLCRAIEDYRPFFVEDPIRSENPMSYRRVRDKTAIPLAAGEQYGSKWDFREIVENELIDMARIDVCIAGGLTEARKIASWCETHFIDIAVHNPIGPVAAAACLHLNLSIPNFAVQELPRRPGECMPDAITGDLAWEDGCLLPPTAPGLGVEIDRSAVKNYPFEITELPHIRRADGSFTNW